MGAKVKRINSKEELSQGLQEILSQWFDPSKWKGMSKGERPTPGRSRSPPPRAEILPHALHA